MKKLLTVLLFALFSVCAFADQQVRFYASAAAAGTTGTETAITLTKSAANAATSTGVSFLVPTAKRFHITHILVTAVGHTTATAQTTTFSLRINAGAVTTSSTPILLQARVVTGATSNQSATVNLTLPETGLDIYGDGTEQFGLTANAVYTTNAPTWDVIIVGHEI